MTELRNAMLAGVIADPRGGRIDGNNVYRRYKSTIRTSSTIGGNTDHRLTQISYEIGRAIGTKGQALSRVREEDLRVDASYPTPHVLAEDFAGLMKKYSNFSSTFEFSSLGGIVERLGRGLAAASVFSDVDSADLRGGRVPIIHSLGSYDGPASAMTSTVFIPRLVNTNITGDVFSVLVDAITGEGGCIATDVLELDAVTRQAIVYTIDSMALPRAIVDALRILGSNMIAADQGPLFALCLTRGIHRVLSVVGHTDEGGVTRDLLRCGAIGTPFGGIHPGLEPYSGIPALSTNALPQLSAYVDGIALTTAALVTHCDPGLMLNGEWFPTFYLGTDANDPTVRPGDSAVGTPAMAARNRAQLLGTLSTFSDLYTNALGQLFAASGNHVLASNVFCTASTQLDRDPRHLRYPSVAPWFWIEPTSLLPANYLGTRAESEGAGSFGGKSSTVTLPAWTDIRAEGISDTTFSSYVATMKTARSAKFLLHWLDHPDNGLGAITIRQMDPNGIIHPGACATDPQVRDRIEANRSIADYLWARGQSPFPAPSELMNLSCTVGFLVKHVTFDDEGHITLEHVPTQNEFLDCHITVTVGHPRGISTGASNYVDSTVRRAKTHAARELSASSARARAYGTVDVHALPILTSAPTMRAPPPPRVHPTPNNNPPNTINFVRNQHQGEPEGQFERGPAGPALVPVPHHAAQNYPQVPRLGNPVGGGGPIGAKNPPSSGPHPQDDGNVSDNEPPAPIAPAGAAPPNVPNQQ